MQYFQAQPPMFLSQTGAIMYQQANIQPQPLQHGLHPGLIYYQPVPYYQVAPYMMPKTQNLSQSTPVITHSAQPVVFSQEKPKKKKPSPSAKRRSRLRLMAFLEQKKKAAAENGEEEQEPNQRSKSPDEGCDIDEKT